MTDIEHNISSERPEEIKQLTFESSPLQPISTQAPPLMVYLM